MDLVEGLNGEAHIVVPPGMGGSFRALSWRSIDPHCNLSVLGLPYLARHVRLNAEDHQSSD